MKIFTKTLLFFVALILLESILTLLLITKIVSRNNLSIAKIELSNEASLIYDSHNSWKRKIWKSLIDIKNDEEIKKYLTLQSYFAMNRISYLLESRFIRSGIDYILIKTENSVNLIPLTTNTVTENEFSSLIIRKPHPYLEIRRLKNYFIMIGSLRVIPPSRLQGESSSVNKGYFDIFLIKRMDNPYCKSLTLNRDSNVSFFTDNSLILSHEMVNFIKFFSTLSVKKIYEPLYNVEIGKKYYNIAVQRLENIYPENQTLFIATIISNEPYLERIASIREITFYVTGSVAFLSIIISLFFSKNITNPIQLLLNAMHKLKIGEYRKSIKIKGKNEISELLTGFNEMAEKIMNDRVIMENYIKEIMILNDFNEKVFNSLHAGILILNNNLNVLKANKYFCKTFGLDGNKIIDRPLNLLDVVIIDDEVYDHVKKIVESQESGFTIVKRLEYSKVFEIKLYPFTALRSSDIHTSGCIVVVEDISKKVEFEEKILQAEKLSSLSILTAGVAHEINNPLSSIMSNVQNLIEDERDPDRSVSLKWIEQETRRIANIVHELLAFSSSKADNLELCDINDVIEQVSSIVKYAVSKDKEIEIRLKIDPNLPKAAINSDEIKQVIVNILNNSIHAISKSGMIQIITRYMVESESIKITIKDNGIGIEEKNIPRIFDPFFTTRKNGIGTGLGLSIVYGIITKHGGRVSIKSRVGKGTTINLEIPAVGD